MDVADGISSLPYSQPEIIGLPIWRSPSWICDSGCISTITIEIIQMLDLEIADLFIIIYLLFIIESCTKHKQNIA
jgi:hypothetical protein